VRTYANQSKKLILRRSKSGKRESFGLFMGNLQNGFMPNFSLFGGVDVHQPVLNESTFE